MRAIFGFKFHANLCKLPQFLASIKQRFFHMEEAEKLTFQTIPNLPWFIPKFVRNRCFREWLHLCRVENQSSESSFTSKGCLPKPFEISFCGTYLKVGIEEQSCDFFSWELCSVKTHFCLICSTGSMALLKKKVYSWFCVGTMMKAQMTAQEQIAAAHKSVAALRKNLESLMAKRRRLEAKIIFLFLIERFLCIEPEVILWKLTIMFNMLNMSSCSKISLRSVQQIFIFVRDSRKLNT